MGLQRLRLPVHSPSGRLAMGLASERTDAACRLSLAWSASADSYLRVMATVASWLQFPYSRRLRQQVGE